jgi:hypothetical protein
MWNTCLNYRLTRNNRISALYFRISPLNAPRVALVRDRFHPQLSPIQSPNCSTWNNREPRLRGRLPPTKTHLKPGYDPGCPILAARPHGRAARVGEHDPNLPPSCHHVKLPQSQRGRGSKDRSPTPPDQDCSTWNNSIVCPLLGPASQDISTAIHRLAFPSDSHAMGLEVCVFTGFAACPRAGYRKFSTIVRVLHSCQVEAPPATLDKPWARSSES